MTLWLEVIPVYIVDKALDGSRLSLYINLEF
jgi:hypothetical protein